MLIPWGRAIASITPTVRNDLGNPIGGATVTWVSQASFKPPLVMAAIRRESNVFRCLFDSRFAAINILGAHQQRIAAKFFCPTEADPDVMNGEPFTSGRTSAPILRDAPAYIECYVRQIMDSGGDHAVVIMEVVEAVCREQVRPLTIAARLEHVGRYGPAASDARLTPLVVGLQTLVRGYDVRNFAADQCGRSATECSVIDELAGSRLGVANLELRAPLLGLLTGDLDYGTLPIEGIAFADAGFLWTRSPGGAAERHHRLLGRRKLALEDLLVANCGRFSHAGSGKSVWSWSSGFGFRSSVFGLWYLHFVFCIPCFVFLGP